MKSDFGGHDNWHHDNVYAFVGRGFSICGQLPGHGDIYTNNYVVQNRDGDYGSPSCDQTTLLHSNQIYTPTGNVTECGMSLAAYQAKGHDVNTTAAPFPASSAILDAARTALGMN